MKFGMSLYPFARYPDAKSVLEVARVADDLGYETITIGEHVLVPRPQVATLPAAWYDPLTLGGFIAGATRRLRILFSVLVIPYYHPVRLAKAIATLDVLSAGRVTVGIGSGWLQKEFDFMGVPFEERGPRTDECLRAMIELWTAETPSFKGRWVQFDDVVFDPPCFTKPHPPIWIGGFGQTAMRRAVELGDGLYPATMGPMSRIVENMEKLRGRLKAAGRDPARFAFSHGIDYGGTTESKYASQSTPMAGQLKHLAFGFDPGPILEHVAEAERAGTQAIMVRFPGRDHREVIQAMERFHRDIMSP